MTQAPIKRALFAVSDKTGIVDFGQQLTALGVEILSTGGTARTLRDGGVEVREVSDVTKFPEIMGGRVKTLHPKIHGGILARRNLTEDQEAMQEHGIEGIDLVVINLYPFEQTVSAQATRDEIVEQIDIGGPAMVRAAAKNHAHVAIVVNPDRYGSIIDELQQSGGSIAESTRRQLATEAFQRTAAYDAAISNWFGDQESEGFPAVVTEQWHKVADLRYGENPHQGAAFYRRNDGDNFSIADAKVTGDKELSYNNLLDASAAIDCVRGLQSPAAVVVKHCLPCGAAEADNLTLAFEQALAGDPLSAFGGILALNAPLTRELAQTIASPKLFFEVISAPSFEPGAVDAIRSGAKWGKNCRLLEGGDTQGQGVAVEARAVPGGVLLQHRDQPQASRENFEVVSEREPTDKEWDDLLFAWRVIPHVRSNAILLAANRSVLGVGSGQPSRVDAVRIACNKAAESCNGSVLASDAFFPFPDGLEVAAESGVQAAIQPGGSIRDAAVIEAANRHGMALVHTGERHFRH